MSQNDRGFEYRADLRETALPEMFHTVDRFQVPGVVEAEKGGVLKKVFVRDGHVVHASSSDRSDSLGAYLQRTGKITAEEYEETMQARTESGGKRYGEILIERGTISPAEVHEAIRKHVEAIVWSLFYWQEGEVRFRIGTFEAPSHIRILLPMRQVILEGIKRAPNAKALVARLGGRDTVLEPAFTAEDAIAAALGAEEYELLGLIDGERTFYELCTDGPLSAPENAKLVYAFHVLRLVRRRPTEADRAQGSREEPGAGDEPPGQDAPEDEAEPKAIKIRFKTAGDQFA